MHSFYDMIEIMERDRPLDEDWKKWAIPAAIAAGSLASAYRAVNYPTKPNAERPAAVSREVDEAPHRGDARWERFKRVLGVGRAEEDLRVRQSQYSLGAGGMGGEIPSKSKGGLGIGGMGGNYPKKSVTSDAAGEYLR